MIAPAHIAYFVHGRGRGHASRTLSVVPALRAQGHAVALHASGQALDMLAELGDVAPRPLVEPGSGALLALASRALRERRALVASGARLVIADGDQGALLAARAAQLPSIAIGHDLVFSRCVLPDGLSWPRLLHQRLNALVPARLSTRRVAVHFLPVRARDAHTRVARADVAPALRAASRGDRLVCYFRDDNGERAVRLARSVCNDVAAYGRGGDQAPLTREQFRSLLATARGVIGSAGSNLIAECILLQTPLLALYREDDHEQALNAQLLAAHGAGMACSFARLDPRVLSAFWSRARAGHFAAVALETALPTVVEAVLEAVRELEQ